MKEVHHGASTSVDVHMETHVLKLTYSYTFFTICLHVCHKFLNTEKNKTKQNSSQKPTCAI